MNLTKIPLPAERYFHTFVRPDKTEFDIETTQADYDQLAQAPFTTPTHADGVWAGKSRRVLIVPDGTYAVENDYQCVMNVGDGTGTWPIKKEFIVGDNLTLAGVEEFTRLKVITGIEII